MGLPKNKDCEKIRDCETARLVKLQRKFRGAHGFEGPLAIPPCDNVRLKQKIIQVPPLIETVNIMAYYLRIKQSLCVMDIYVSTIQAIIRSWWKMQVHVRHARFDKCSQEAAPNENGPHVLFRTKEQSMS